MLSLWLARLLIALLAVASLLPALPVGAWYVRVWDFPRMQLAAATLLPLLLLVFGCTGMSWRGERGGLLLLGLALLVWQSSHVIPYTGLVRPAVEGPGGQSEHKWMRLVIANLQYDNAEKQAVLDELKSHTPDLLLLVEVDQAWRQALLPLHDELPHECGEVRDDGLGLLLWSRWPLEGCEVQRLISEQRPSIHTRVHTPGGSVRLIGVHPTPPGLIYQNDDDRHDSRVRDAELIMVAKEVKRNAAAPYIVTGDFNDVAWSGTTKLFQSLSGLRDPRVGRGLYNTFPTRYPFLRFPIDHVFLSPGFAVRELDRFVLPGSDHFGVITEVAAPAVVRQDPDPTAEEKSRGEELIDEGQEDAQEDDKESDANPRDVQSHTEPPPAG